MIKITSFILTLILSFTFGVSRAYAITDPLSVPNNKFGVHILFTTELSEATSLVNSSGGDWGYVTIPIQTGDKDLEKWQKFMDDATRLHLIPIIRIAIENNYFNTRVWRKPEDTDVLDFANFLDSLDWPTKNRYVVILNEVNRSDEWGDEVNAREYAEILSYAAKTFKSLNPDFFIVSAGLDNAAPNRGKEFMNQYDFISEMENAVPGIFNQIDGFASHSYPNPGFSQPPWVTTPKSISSFKYEKDLIRKISNKDLPVFITETGWSFDKVDEGDIGSYYEEAFKSVWNNDFIVAITPFLLKAGGNFSQFSLINERNEPTLPYKVLGEINKPKGSPILSDQIINRKADIYQKKLLPTRSFQDTNSDTKQDYVKLLKLDTVKNVLKWFIQP